MSEFDVAKVGEISDGALAKFEVSGTDVAVANVEGTLYAFGDVCTHAQCSLADGDLEGTTVTCPCHGSQFDVTSGAVVNPPAAEPVPTFPVRADGDVIKIDV